MAVIEKRIAPDGVPSFRVKIRLRGHRPKSATFTSLTDARRWAQKEEADIRRGLKFDDHHAQNHTLSDAIAEYRAYPAHKMKPKQVEQRKKHLEWWEKELGSLRLAEVILPQSPGASRYRSRHP